MKVLDKIWQYRREKLEKKWQKKLKNKNFTLITENCIVELFILIYEIADFINKKEDF